MSTSIQNATFYVSQLIGDDSFSGMCPTAAGVGEGPFQTLQRAIAASVGYDNAHFFSKLFKKKTGVSPKAYREGGL